jgi:hypothetical protein
MARMGSIMVALALALALAGSGAAAFNVRAGQAAGAQALSRPAFVGSCGSSVLCGRASPSLCGAKSAPCLGQALPLGILGTSGMSRHCAARASVKAAGALGLSAVLADYPSDEAAALDEVSLEPTPDGRGHVRSWPPLVFALYCDCCFLSCSSSSSSWLLMGPCHVCRTATSWRLSVTMPSRRRSTPAPCTWMPVSPKSLPKCIFQNSPKNVFIAQGSTRLDAALG